MRGGGGGSRQAKHNDLIDHGIYRLNGVGCYSCDAHLHNGQFLIHDTVTELKVFM
jgi:hypothetical protein